MLELIVLGNIPGTSVFLSFYAIGIGLIATGLIASAYIARKRLPRKTKQTLQTASTKTQTA